MSEENEDNGDLEDAFQRVFENVRQTHEELKKGIICDCGGIMRYTGSQSLCPSPNGGFEDHMSIRCEKCGKDDIYVKPVKF